MLESDGERRMEMVEAFTNNAFSTQDHFTLLSLRDYSEIMVCLRNCVSCIDLLEDEVQLAAIIERHSLTKHVL